MSARLYVEGGGDGKDLRTRCRKAFASFLEKAGLEGRMPRIVACGPRNEAYKRFKTAFEKRESGDFMVLLVDSERPVRLPSTWQHLAEPPDKWDTPSEASDENAHLMVQCMEAWLLADPDTLDKHFGRGFQKPSLPANQNIEQVAKEDLLAHLATATRGTKAKRYHKGRHSFALLGQIDPARVEKASPHARRFLEAMRANCG